MTNHFSDEKICVGLIANMDSVPHLGLSDKKLNFALASVKPELRASIRKSFKLLDFDVNKIRRGQDTLPLFDAPYSKKLLKELAHKKRGLISYSDLFELSDARTEDFAKLFHKFTGEVWNDVEKTKPSLTFKKRFREYVSDKKFEQFQKQFKLRAEEFPLLFKDIKVDLYRQSNYLTVFHAVDLDSGLSTIHRNISEFRLLIQSLTLYSEQEGLSKGRYYLVAESPKENSKREILSKLKNEKKKSFEVVNILEMRDKI